MATTKPMTAEDLFRMGRRRIGSSEVLSPSERAGAIAAKVALYLGAGVRLVWLIQPRTRTFTVHRADGNYRAFHLGDELDGGSTGPGFHLPVVELFRDEP